MDSHRMGRDRADPGTMTPAEQLRAAEERLLERYAVAAQVRSVEVPALPGTAHVLAVGEGPPLAMVIGGAIPGACWIPLMARLAHRSVYAIELPGFGLTDPTRYHHETLRRTAVGYLSAVLDGLGIRRAPFVTQSMGSQWTTWLAADQPDRVSAQVMVGCPAFFLDTSAIWPFRLASVPGLGPLVLRAQRPSPRNVERLLRLVGEDPSGLEELRALLLADQQVPGHAESLLGLMRAAMRWGRPRPEVVTTPEDLGRVPHPVRMVWGRDDPFGPPEAGRRMAALLPHADFHLVPGGHAPWFHRAEQVADLTDDVLGS